MDMKKHIDELRPEYDLTQLKGCVRGKHAIQANEALRTLIQLRGSIAAVASSTFVKEREQAKRVVAERL
jgi:hypothetical protein